MLGNHDGIEPLENFDEIKSPALKAMAKSKCLKDVPSRLKTLRKAHSQIGADDRYWPETLASRLTDEGIDAVPAQFIALSVAAAIRDNETASIFRAVNSGGSDTFSQAVVQGLMAADKEFAEKLRAMKIDSDQVFLRVALAHFFRRDPSSVFQMFGLNGVAHQVSKLWSDGVVGFTQWAIDRVDEVDVPEDVTGYLVVLRKLYSKGGFYMYPPTELSLKTLDHVFRVFAETTGSDDEDEAIHAACATAFELMFGQHRVSDAVGLMSAVAEKYGHRHLILYGSEDDKGTKTQLFKIPATSVEEARRIARSLPQVTTHDDFRRLSEKMDLMTPRDRNSADA